jgi:hypothetical protein
MKRDPRFGGVYLGVAVAAVVGLAVLVPARTAGSAEPCCFANDRYQGTCTVVPGEGETCESILSYLNNPMSTGKSYCGGTRVRGGWAQVDCKTGKSVMHQSAAGSPPKPQKPAPTGEKGASK